MWELDYKESWALKNWCFWTVVFKTLHFVEGERGNPCLIVSRFWWSHWEGWCGWRGGDQANARVPRTWGERPGGQWCPSSELYKKHISPPIGFAFKNVEDKICWFVSTFFLLSGSWFVSNIGRLLGNSASIDLDTWVELLADSTESGTQYPQHQAVSVKIWKLHQKGHDDLI